MTDPFNFFNVKTPKTTLIPFWSAETHFQLDILKTIKLKFHFETLQYNTKWNLANTMKQNGKKRTGYKNKDQSSSDILTLPKFLISTRHQTGEGDKSSERLSGKKSIWYWGSAWSCKWISPGPSNPIHILKKNTKLNSCKISRQQLRMSQICQLYHIK